MKPGVVTYRALYVDLGKLSETGFFSFVTALPVSDEKVHLSVGEEIYLSPTLVFSHYKDDIIIVVSNRLPHAIYFKGFLSTLPAFPHFSSQ